MRGFHLKAVLCALVLGAPRCPPSRITPARCSTTRRTVTVTGVVKEFQYTNPHSWLLVDVKGSDGKVTTWGFEAEGPSTLLRAGIRKSDFLAGTEVTITGNPMRDGRPAAAWLKAVRMTDKKEFNPRSGFAVR